MDFSWENQLSEAASTCVFNILNDIVVFSNLFIYEYAISLKTNIISKESMSIIS